MMQDISSALRLKLGALNVVDGSKTPFGATIAAFPRGEEEAAFCIARAREAGLRVVCAGGGAYVDSLAPLPPASLLLSSHRMTRIVEHQPENLVMTAEAGVTLATLQDALRRHRQFLPINVPDPDTATLAGIVSAAATGSWRAAYGPVRDWVLEVRGIDGMARDVRGGARVVKNVAGYDIPKLYTGSRGTLAFITQVTFKVRPMPEQVTRLLFSAATWEALHARLAALAASEIRPTIVEVVRADIRDPAERPTAVITLEGSAETVQWQVVSCSEVLRGEGAMIGRVDYAPQPPRGGDVEVTVRVIPSTIWETLARVAESGWRGSAAYCPVEGRISLRCTAYPDTIEQIEAIRAYVEPQGGGVTIERMPRAWAGVVSPFGAPRPDAPLAQAIKAALDPDNVFPTLPK
ncbi:MAG TPA: FAD-binding oxidoreductase [Armatimonadota bacterium]|jgi:glycolate oxidase FAD binding subunit